MPYDTTISFVPIHTWSVSSSSNEWQKYYVQTIYDTCKEIEIKEEDLVDILEGEENDK